MMFDGDEGKAMPHALNETLDLHPTFIGWDIYSSEDSDEEGSIGDREMSSEELSSLYSSCTSNRKVSKHNNVNLDKISVTRSRHVLPPLCNYSLSDFGPHSSNDVTQDPFCEESESCVALEGNELSAMDVARTDCLTMCLKFNQACMDSLDDMETKLNFALKKIKEKSTGSKGNVKTCAVQRGCLRAKRKRFFADAADGSVCPPNEDVMKKESNNETTRCCFPNPFHWTHLDRAKLRDTIVHRDANERFRSTLNSLEEKRLIRKKSKVDIKEEPTQDDLQEGHDFILRSMKDYDWTAITLQAQLKQSPKECRVMWANCLHPWFNTLDWKKNELFKLNEIAKKLNCQNWDRIASLLDTNRSALQCFNMHQVTNTNHSEIRYMWSQEDDKILMKLVNQNIVGTDINWHRVVFNIPHCNMNQVIIRWKYSLDPSIKRGKFKRSEDIAMVMGVKKYGTNFKQIAKHFVPTRTTVQLRERYYRIIPSFRKGKWSRQEDHQLAILTSFYGEGNWVAISKHFMSPHRTRIQVRSRYFNLKRTQQLHRPFNEPISEPASEENCLDYQYEPTLRLLTKATKARSIPGRKWKVNDDLDRDIENFLIVNYHQEREDITPGSLMRAFQPTTEEIETRANHSKLYLDILMAKLNIPTRSKIIKDKQLSNRDKMTILKLQDQFENPGKPTNIFVDQVLNDWETGTDDEEEEEEEEVAPSLPVPSETCKDVEYFLPPTMETVLGLQSSLRSRSYLVAENLHAEIVANSGASGEISSAESLWFNRFRTLFLFPALMSNVEPTFIRQNEPSIQQNTEKSGRKVTLPVTETTTNKNNTFAKRCVGRPKKRSMTSMVKEKLAKRKYKKTGNYSWKNVASEHHMSKRTKKM